MDFSWTDAQRQLYNDVVTFAQNELHTDVVSRDKAGEFSRDDWQKCADFGIQGLLVPPEYGGRGYDLLTTMLAMEGLGYGCHDNGLTFALNAEMVSTQAALLQAANEAQKQKYLRGVTSGQLIGAYAMTEPGSGSDAFSLTTSATAVDGGYLLNGRKHLITFAPIADFAIVFATVYFYNSQDFVVLLLAQPIARSTVIWGFYLGLCALLFF